MEHRWRFFHDGYWRWHRLSLSGHILDESDQDFATLHECVLNAGDNGYPMARRRYARVAADGALRASG